jgi:hypothetical protein
MEKGKQKENKVCFPLLNLPRDSKFFDFNIPEQHMHVHTAMKL